MDLLGGLQQTRPVFFLELLLAQHQLDLTVTVVDLAVLGVDLGEQVERDVVFYALLGVACKSNVGRLDVEGGVRTGNISSLDANIEVVALGVAIRRALSPCD